MSGIDPVVRLQVYDAIFHYVDSGEVQTMSDIAAAVFAFIRVDLDLEAKRKAAISEKKRAAGQKGGAPKGNDNARKKKKQKQKNTD